MEDKVFLDRFLQSLSAEDTQIAAAAKNKMCSIHLQHLQKFHSNKTTIGL